MKTLVSFFRVLLLLLAINCFTNSYAQISAGGIPPSFYFETENEILTTTENLPITFDVVAMREEDATRKLDNLPPRVGKTIPVNFTTENSGEWTLLPNGQDIWRLCIMAEDAIAIMLLYDKFEIPEGGKLFIYNEDRSQVIGAFTEINNPKKAEFSTEFVAGDIITLEYLAPTNTNYETPIVISGVGYAYNNLFVEKSPNGKQSHIDFRSDPCEVNINCPEGNNWQDQKKGVARIIIPAGGGYIFYCSGTIVNNTAQDLEPLFLSAYHCYNEATTTQINQSQYYFHYEYTGCPNSGIATQKTMTGATLLVITPMSGGSDGALLKLNNAIPASYDVYYNGWDRRNVGATSGVSIHHPDGDRKKISTFTSSLVSTGSINFGGGNITAPNSAWRVQWAPTVTNHGVTEGGSSGSPIFNQNGLVVGTLSGGGSFCTAPYQPDYYGKLWYHWDQMSNPAQKMQPYLDPANTGAEFIEGIFSIPLPPAENLTATYIDNCTKVVLEWDAPETTDVIKYKVFRDNSQIATNITQTTYTDDKFNQNAGHTWAVSVVYPSDESARISETLELCIKNFTVSLTANPEAGGTVSGEGDYEQNEEATVVATPNEKYKFINWTKGTSSVSTDSAYTFNVTADIALVANFEYISGIEENRKENFFTIYPNPADKLLNIVRKNVGKAQIAIYNNMGQLIQSYEINEQESQINITTLTSGIYLIRLIDGNISSTQSFLKK